MKIQNSMKNLYLTGSCIFAFTFASRPIFVSAEFHEDHKTVTKLRCIWLPSVLGILADLIKRSFYVLFLQKAHCTEHPSRGCPHLALISHLSLQKQCR